MAYEMSFSAYKSFNTELSDKDRECLVGYFRLADTIADFIGPHCELVIHSFENFEQSVVKIINGHQTGREVGSPMTDLGLKMLRHVEKTGELTPKSYFTKNKDGALLKSTTCVLAGEGGRPIGMFCINMNLSYPFSEIMQTLMPDIAQHNGAVIENFNSNATDVITQALDNTIRDIENDPTITLKGKNKAIAKQLLENGIFELKDATPMVAERLGVTRHAVYKYIREFKL
ncbi:transcriptional regulator [Rheinheimera salexigens]